MVKPQRDLSYEFIRVVSMILIILAHEIPNYLGQFSRLGVYTELVTNVGVTLFFMLSGKFALKLNLEDKHLYKKYYWKKVIGLIIPMLVYMAIKNWHIMVYHKHLTVTPGFYVHHFLLSLFNGFSYMEYWFLFVLIALLASTPFTARMIQNFKRRDQIAFTIVGLIFGAITTFLPHLLDVEFAIKYEFIGYALFFYIGFFIEDFFKEKSACKKLYLIGLLSLIINCILTHFNIRNGYKNTSPFYFTFTVATFIALRNFAQYLMTKHASPLLDRLTIFLGQHSLGVYMIHMMFLFTFNDLNLLPRNLFGWLLSTLIILVISVIASFILDRTIIKLLQKLCIKIFRLEKTLAK